MAEGFVLNIPKEMLDRLQKADEKIEKLDKNSRRVSENIRLAFMEGAKGVDKFIGSLNSAQKILNGFKDKKINVGLNLDAKSVTDLKKQLESLGGVNIPVGVTGTGGGNAGESQSLKNLLNGIVTLTTSVNNLTHKIDGIKVTGSGSTSGGRGSSNSGKQQPTKVDPIVNSQNAKSITERIQAIKLLQKEMFNLDTTDKNYQKTLNTLNTELTRQQNVLKQVGVEISKIKTPKIEIPKPNFEPLRQQYRQNQSELKNLQSEYDNVVKKIKEAEAQMANIRAGKGGSYNPKEYQQNLGKAFNLEQEIKMYQDENKLISEKMRLLNQEYQAKVKVQQATDPKNLALIAKEKKEYEEITKRIRDLRRERDKANNDVKKYGSKSSVGISAQNIIQQNTNEINELNKRKQQLEMQYGEQLNEIKRRNNVQSLNDLRRIKEEELKVIAQAEQKALQQYTKLASERNRLLTEQYNNQKIIDNPKTDNATRQQAIKQQQLIADELQRNKQAMLNIEQQYQGKLATIQQRAGQQELQRMRRQSQQEIDEIRRAEQRRQDIQRRWDERRYSRPQGALQYSQNAKTINEQIKAIEYLKKAQKSLDVSTTQGKKQFYELEQEIKRTENALRRYGQQISGVREQSSHLFNISQQLGRALSLMFSVSQIGQYISKMVNVRKEMELQQRSLQVLLQSKDKANELWNQTLDLAVKSPFRVKELVTYTKQLAAYRIESDKLFETNKMLADVSAGLGVDMQRLILAFGQVKSASFLRGCLGKGTLIRLYNDDIKEVQDIVVGDVIMGDDNAPRNVKEVIYGKEQMYIVKQGVCGDDYRVNENHILTLKDKITDTIVDVYVKDYLKNKERYNGVKIGKNNNIIDYPIELIKDNIDEYFGFVIDGNKRFLLGDGTITHNTELRQFTEAGIPMLEQLSKYFSEIYGKSISVAEVFDMISKRMVTFTDVEAVFQRMTSAGGVFFNMQEELSQTTAGMISNLQDSIDLMFNEIGKKNQGIINTAIKWARGLVNNWETVGMVMKGTLFTLLLYKAATMDVDKMLLKIMYKWDDIKNITVNFTKGNAVMLALTAIIALLIKRRREADQYTKAIEEVNKAHDKFRDSISNVELGFSNLFSQGVDDIEEYKGKLQELVGIAQQSYNIEMDFEIKNLESIDEVSRKFDELKAKILSFDNLSLQFDLDFTKQSDRGWEWFQDYLETDLKQLSSAQKDIKTLASEIQGLISGTIKDVAELDNLNKRGEELSLQYQSLIQAGKEQDAQKVKNEINSIAESIDDLKSKLKGVDIDIAKSLFPRGVDESEYEYLQRVADGISRIYDVYKPNDKNTLDGASNAAKILGIDMEELISLESKLTTTNKGYIGKLDEATKELTAFYEEAHADIANLVNTSLRGETLGFEPEDLIKAIKEATDENYNNLSEVITKELSTRGVEVNKELNQLLQQIVKAQDPNKVNEELKRLVDILNKQSLDEEVSDYVYNSLKKIATDKELDETTFHEILKQAERYFSTNALKDNEGKIILETLDLDLIPEEKKPDSLELKEWQKAYNEEVDEILSTLESSEDKAIFLPLKIRTDLQGVATTKEQQRELLNNSIDAAQKEIDNLKIANEYLKQQYKSNDLTLEQYTALYDENIKKQEKYIKLMSHLRNLLGGDDDKEKDKKKKQQEILKNRISLIKELNKKYEELSKTISKSEAVETISRDYAQTFKEAFEGTGVNLSDIIVDKDKFSSLIESAKESGQIFGEKMLESMNAALSSGDLIRMESEAFREKLKGNEGFVAQLYDDSTKEIIKNIEDYKKWLKKEEKGTLTIGYGHAVFEEEEVKRWLGVILDGQAAIDLLNEDIAKHRDILNNILDKNKEIVLTQEQYDILLNKTFQGGGVIKWGIEYAKNIEKAEAHFTSLAQKMAKQGYSFDEYFGADFVENFKKSESVVERFAMVLRTLNLTTKATGSNIDPNLFSGMFARADELYREFTGTLEVSKLLEQSLQRISNIDFTTPEGVVEALEMLSPIAEREGEEAVLTLIRAISAEKVEIGIDAKIKKDAELIKDLEDMFGNYELTLEMEKLNIPKDLAQTLFNFESVDLSDLKSRIQDEISKIGDNAGQTDLYKNLVSLLDKVNQEEDKRLKERLKTYYKYLLNEQHERVKIRMETLRKLNEVENENAYTTAQKETIQNKLKEEEKESLAKQTWKDFETSPVYMQMFDDIENMSKGALEQMIVTMDGLKTKLQSMGLPASDLKEILSQINKVEEELERRNPFRNFAENANIALNRSKELARLEEQRAKQQANYDDTKSTYDKHQDLLAQEEEKLKSLQVGSEEYQKQLAWVELLRITTNNLAKDVKKIESNLSETNNQINNTNASSNDFYEQLKNIGSITKSVVDGVFQITDAMSWLPEETQLSLERMKGLSDSAFTIAGGIGSIMSGDIIGGITSLISGISGLVSLFMEWSSGAKEAAIETERQGRLLTDLQNKYDKLNKAIDEAWNVAQIKQYNAELQKNLQQQIVAQKAIIEAQKSVKGANDYGSEQWSAVKEAEEELQNLYDTQEELQKNIYSKLTGGIMDDILSTTESFVDAWYDAFKETGDGLKGLEDNFNEMLLNLVKRQAAMKIAGRFVDEWNDALERYASDGDLSNSEIEYYANKVKNDLPALSSQLETFFSSFDNVIGDVSGNLSGLQRGIQGITEQQADILASYLNSIRFIVSDSNSQLKALLAAQTSTSASNPIVAQLQVIAQQSSAINTLLNTLVKGGHGLGGNGLKVFI